MTLPVGIAITHTVYDEESKRTTCGGCARTLATGQKTCVCGAVFEGRLAAFGNATAAEIGRQELEQR